MEAVVMTKTSIWKNRSFTKMFAAHGLSSFGDWFDFVAMGVLFSYVWKAEPMLIAVMPLCYAVPSIFLSQWAGVIADRKNKLRLMIVTDLIRAFFTAMLIFASSPIWALLLLSFRSTAVVFQMPCQQALTRNVVPDEFLLKATSLNGVVFQLSKVLGPLLGASILTFFSPVVCLLVNMISFLLSALLMFSIGKIEEEDSQTDSAKEQKVDGSWKEGWTVIFQNQMLLFSIVLFMIAILAIQMVDIQFIVLLREVVPNHPEWNGWGISVFGTGALCTVLVLQKYKELKAYGWVLGGGIFLVGVSFAAAGFLHPDVKVIWLIVFGFIGGIGTGLCNTGFTYLLLSETPKDVVGRVSGIYQSLTSGVLIIAPLLGGAIVTAIGVELAFQMIGAGIVAIGAFAILFQKMIWRKAG